MTVSVIVPWQPGCPHRAAALEWVRPKWAEIGEVVLGECSGPWVKADAVADGLSRATGDRLVIPDADVFLSSPESVKLALDALDSHAWAVPHRLVHRLSQSSTASVLAGADWHDLPLDTSTGAQDAKPYIGFLGGGITVTTRTQYEMVPLDRRFVGWGQEDQSWAMALTCLAGPPWRGTDDLVHLWHPPQQRRSRVTGSTYGRTLHRRYLNASRSPERMRNLIEESRHGR